MNFYEYYVCFVSFPVPKIRSSFGLPLDNSPIIDKPPPQVLVKGHGYPSQLPNPDVKDEAQGLVNDGDEMVDIHSELQKNGHINLTFTSHGKRHKLDLTESKLDLKDIPIKLVGKSSEFEDEVMNKMKVLIIIFLMMLLCSYKAATTPV